MTDVGVIGFLRRQQIETQSMEVPAKLYWESRREPLSPRIESLFASFLINLAAAVVYDVLKELAAANYDVAPILQERGANLTVIAGFAAELRIFIEHARIFMRLHRAKEDVRRLNEVRDVIKAVLSNEKIAIENPDADAAFDILMANLVPAVQGVIKEELKKGGIFVADQADAVLSRGHAASPGFGIGAPVRWKRETIHHIAPYILLIGNQDAHGEPDPRLAIEQSAGVVSWDGGMYSHIAIACRIVRRAAVIISAQEAAMLERKKFLVVDGTNGEVRSYHHRPPPIEAYPYETRKKLVHKHRRTK